MSTTRRDFIKNTSLAAAAATLATEATLLSESAEAATVSSVAGYKTPATVRRGDMVYRQLGGTGDEVSLIGLGGFHIGTQSEEAASIKIIHASIERGITFMDNCWDYNDGTSEVRMGKALSTGGRRDKVFLMTKLDGRDKKTAARQIDESLARLKTDHVDLLQHHEIIRLDDPDRIFAKGGAHEAVMEAVKAGKVRHVGFTGHKDPFVHLRMLEVGAKHGFKPVGVQMPVNVMDPHFRSFQGQVMPKLVAQNIAVLAMKTFGDPYIVEHMKKSGTATPIDLLHFSMSQPVAVVITGIDSLKYLDQAVEAARTFKPMTTAQKTAMLSKTRIAAAQGHLERFKTSEKYDGTIKNPQWLGDIA